MRPYLSLCVTSVATLALLGGVGLTPAQAKSAVHPWSAYLPAQGVTCQSQQVTGEGTRTTSSTTVLKKSAKVIVTKSTGQPRVRTDLLSGGRTRTVVTAVERGAGMKTRVTQTSTLPSPAKLSRHGRGTGTLTMTMKLPRSLAAALLKKGRVLTVSGTYRSSGLGTKTIVLADPAKTSVTAIGFRTTLRSFKVSPLKRSAAGLKAEMREVLASGNATTWMAKGRGAVLVQGFDDDGVAATTTQTGCR